MGAPDTRMVATRLEGALPEWMHLLTHWRSLAATLALGVDALIQGVWDLAFAAMPGQNAFAPEHGGFPNTDALPLLGRDRRLFRGLLEAPEAYAARLRRYRQAWQGAGTAFAILDQVAAICQNAGGAPRARLVSSSGTWYTREPGGTFKMHTVDGAGFEFNPATGETAALTTPAHPWDWDSETDPSPSPCRLWLILYAPIAGLVPAHEGTYGDASSWYGDGGLIGLTTTLAFLEQVRGVLGEWVTAGVQVPYVIFAFDPASFDPETPGPYPAAGLPDGWWGREWRPEPGNPTHAIRSRLETARYVRGAPGDGTV